MKTGFLRQSAPLLDRVLPIGDVLIVLVCALGFHVVFYDDLVIRPERMLVLLFLLGATYAVFQGGAVYRSQRGIWLHQEIARLSLCWGLAVTLTGLFAFLTHVTEFISRLWFGWTVLSAFLAFSALRFCVRATLAALRRRGYNSRSIAVVGTGELGQLALRRLGENGWAGYEVCAVFTDPDTEAEGDGTGRDAAALARLAGEKEAHVGTVDELLAFVERMRARGTPVDQVWITLPMRAEAKTRSIIAMLRDSSVDVCVVPSLFGVELLSGSVSQLAELPIINVSDVRKPPIGEWYKGLFDVLMASVILILVSPLLLVIAIAVRLDSPGPILFRQKRYGIDGQEIEIWKFRSMRVADPEDAATVRQATRGDARVTRLGAFLRRTSLDELPQFFNVLQGRMSIVGPRPHAIVHNEYYRHLINGYMLRHKIKPGITGLAQVNGARGETDTLEKMEQRVAYDLEYIRHWSLRLDVKILFLTLLRGFVNRNAY